MSSMPKTAGENLNIDDLSIVIHGIARDHGFWDKPRNLGEMLMLATSELAEALEEDRDGRPTIWFQHTGDCNLIERYTDGRASLDEVRDNPAAMGMCSCNAKPEGALVEIIDCIIRCLDTAQDLATRTRFSVGEVMAMKMVYNDNREHMHGKAY